MNKSFETPTIPVSEKSAMEQPTVVVVDAAERAVTNANAVVKEAESIVAQAADTLASQETKEAKTRLLNPNNWLLKGIVAFQSREAKSQGLAAWLKENKYARRVGYGTALVGVAAVAGGVRGFLVAKGMVVSSGAQANLAHPDMVHVANSIPLEDTPSPSPSHSTTASPSPTLSPSASPSPSPEASVSSSKTATSPTPTPSKTTASPTPTPTPSKASASPSPSTSTSATPKPSPSAATVPKYTPKGGDVSWTTLAEAREKFNNAAVAEHGFDKESRTISRGEGWYHQFNDMGIDKKHHAKLLEDIGPELKKRGLAYYDKKHGEWRMNLANAVVDEHGRKHGVIKDKDLTFIRDYAAKKDYLDSQQAFEPPKHVTVKQSDNLAEATDRYYDKTYSIEHQEVRAELTHDVITDKVLLKELQEAGVLKTQGGKLVLENGSPVFDFSDLKKAKNGTYYMPAEAEIAWHQTMIREALEESQHVAASNETLKPAPTQSPTQKEVKQKDETGVATEIVVSGLAIALTLGVIGFAKKAGAFRQRPSRSRS